MFLSLDGTFFVQLANFAIFFALLNVVFLRPVSNAIMKRRQYINGVLTDYEKYQSEANALRAQGERARAQARRDAEQTIAAKRAEASNATAELAARYAATVQSIVEDAQGEASVELDAARAAAAGQVEQLASLMAGRVLAEAAS
ncbi:MAG: ATP synthase F0 subunit B [Candidatus Eremiobacteraeota bacterium]|nr:ATP synthase F0 subunit B [Candidatus Eremiobacteraeota bacterium]MBV8375311.1 ATP synthase F0 subunit B [Candidatus Eremiobacteraeota bacterium]